MVPDFEYFIRPTLQIMSDGKLRSLEEIRSAVNSHFNFTPEELSETTRSGNNTKVNDRTTWALTYLRQAKLVESPQRAFAQITFEGLELLENAPNVITRDFLFEHYESFRDFQNRSRKKKENPKTKSAKKNSSTSRSEKPPIDIGLQIQNLLNLRSAIKSFKKLGIQPNTEQLDKIAEIESTILYSKLSDGLSDLLDKSFTEISSQFALYIKYDKGKVYLIIDSTKEALKNFPEGSTCLTDFKSEASGTPIKRKRRPNLNFFEMGLITGDVLSYVDDPDVTVSIASENKVIYNGIEYSLTKLTQELKGLPHAIQPTGEWLFEGQNLKDLYNETYSSKKE